MLCAQPWMKAEPACLMGCRRGQDGADLLLIPSEAPALLALLNDIDAQQ
jgi:hypothetical protein